MLPTTVLSSASFVTTAPAVTIILSLTVSLRRIGHPSPNPAVSFQTNRFVSENLMVVQVIVVDMLWALAATNTSSSTVIPPTTMKRELFIITTFLSILILLLRTMVIGSCFLRYYNKQFVYQPVILSRRKERVKSDSLF